MRFLQPALVLIAIVCIALHTVTSASVSKKCYAAKVCIHNAKERCGIDKDGKVRRFLDSCDIAEYNCLKDTEFEKTDISKCQELPAMETEEERQKRLAKDNTDDGNSGKSDNEESKKSDDENTKKTDTDNAIDTDTKTDSE